MEKLSRRKARENALYAFFEMSFGNVLVDIIAQSRDENENSIDTYGEWILSEYANHSQQVDEAINTRLKGWTQDRLPRMSLAVLRLAVTEMLYSREEMDSVVINEAVELSKKYGDENDYQFINGLLGSISREREPEGSDGLEKKKEQ